MITAIHFHGAGLLMPYYFGVVRSLEEHSAVDFAKVKLGGVSAGAVVATMLALGFRYRDIREMGEQYTAWKRGHTCWLIKPHLDEMMSIIKARLLLSHKDLDVLASSIHNLHIRVTAVQRMVHQVTITRFHTYDDLVSAVYGSCNIVPFFDGFRTIRDSCGRRLLDGAFCGQIDSVFEDLPGHITVSPMLKSTIYNRSFSFSQVLLPSEKSTPIIEAGYRDASEFVRSGKPMGHHSEQYFTGILFTLLRILVEYVCYFSISFS